MMLISAQDSLLLFLWNHEDSTFKDALMNMKLKIANFFKKNRIFQSISLAQTFSG